jgi:hypothetical protein
VKDHAGQLLTYFSFEEEPDRGSGAGCWSGRVDPALTECVGAVLSSNARAETHVRLIRTARVKAEAIRVLSTNDASLRMPLN